MKDDKPVSTAQAEQDMLRVLQAERDAEKTIRNCENEAQQIINDVQIKVQRINVHADQRITNMEMRHAHKLNQQIRNIERQGAAEPGYEAGQHYDQERLLAIIEKLAQELCLGSSASVGKTTSADETGTGK
ncbi:MAG: hypothetical protein QNL03_02745 [Gammaproteobacteria bacterium]|nr:hypothetical protein [Gammaproteobacteria bacterium]